MAQAKPISDGYHTLTPHLVVDGAAKAIDFYKRAFAAEELSQMTAPDGKRLMHAELKIGNSRLMLADDFPEYCGGQARDPKKLGASPVTMHGPTTRDPFLLETSRRGVFAAGDVRSGSVKRVASAVGEGSMAIQFVHEYLKEM